MSEISRRSSEAAPGSASLALASFGHLALIALSNKKALDQGVFEHQPRPTVGVTAEQVDSGIPAIELVRPFVEERRTVVLGRPSLRREDGQFLSIHGLENAGDRVEVQALSTWLSRGCPRFRASHPPFSSSSGR